MRYVFAGLVMGTLSWGCAHQHVTRVNPDSTIDLSGRWNDADANRVADQMIDECLRNGWADRYSAQHPGTPPVIRLYPIRNRSDDFINDQFFTKRVEAALLRSGRVKVVEAFEEAADNRGERFDQGQFASPETQHPEHMETGADYVLNGWVVAQNDETEAASVKAYLITMELSHVTSNEKVWIGESRIKKVVDHGE
jgi:hypothetical protein